MRRTKDDAEQTRTAILDAAEVMFCARGIDGTTLEAISRSAGVTRGALYWHFRDKTDLLIALYDRCKMARHALLEQDIRAGHSDPLGLLEQSALDYLTRFEADKSAQHLFQIMSGHSSSNEAREWLEKTNCDIYALLKQAAILAGDKALLAPGFTPKEAAVLLMAVMNGLLSEWLRSNRAFSLTETGGKLLRAQFALLRNGTAPPD
ncbi:MAG: TetR family transcriptional regulator [Paracoccus sp. (in: a-proteobacteria)]|uniref:TetR family transcriptional regulator n=1 Tax=Paracoccus sp. TaxID=267 RepID=UPI0026DFC515|nr:TetR family transcriptional regulator [Paracoccus sp. (in: a-proteobacteria)]MDO5620901.1 TetR family transcriptional regulator [Paracoccus sp. (in: a-proteobacteria)]